MNTTNRQASFFSALGHPNRLRILLYLRGKECCNGVMAEALQIETSNLSRHLKQLMQAGLLMSRKEGLLTCYRITDERIFNLLETAMTFEHNPEFVR
jgi:ArsR family transcriptional regulator, lead/cadmium/zinc/bismuth-responsive transcriptional repressor